VPEPAQKASPDELQIDLKNPGLAAVLAWLWPGAGHLYQGRTAKGIVYMICIVGTFFYGMWLAEGRAVFVYGAWKPEMFRWHYLCQVGAGLPALPAIVQARMPGRQLFGGWYEPPRTDTELNDMHRRLHRYLELGTVFTMIAGLLNVLAIYDAWGGPAYAIEKKDEEPAKTEHPAVA
jgi:hypothetical protein